jgi:long-chain acyl-CoA synthetase
MLSHRTLMAMTACYFMDVDGIGPEDCLIHAAPMSHGSGFYILPHVAAAAKQVIPDSGGFDPAEVVALLGVHRGASMFAAPTMVHRLVASTAVRGADLSGLKTIIYGGGPMYAEDCAAALALLGPKLAQIYGQGESPMTITALSKAHHADTAHPRHAERLASVGVRQTLVEVRVAGPDDEALPPDTVGEVLVRGDAVMLGYWKNPEATAETLRNGWLHTGDLGAMDADGFLTLKDRSKDFIITGGSNVYPREVEEVLLTHPAVAEAAVIGVPHPEWGEEIIAFIVATAQVEATALDALGLDAIARFNRPKRYRFVPELPKNNTGKVLKTALREMVGQG